MIVTAGRSPLGRRVVDHLRDEGSTEFVRGVDVRPRGRGEPGDDCAYIEFVPDHRRLSEYLEKEGIDTVIQCGLAPDRSGIDSKAKESDVIGTMCIGAAIGQDGSSVRNWILASSTAVYPIKSHAALLQHESQHLPREAGTMAMSLLEAEDYARDVAHGRPHVSVAILRLQQLVGDRVRGSLASLLARDPVPTPFGFDPALQLLHLDDAASAIAFVARTDLAGIYNLASKGMIRFGDAVRAMQHNRIPVLPIDARFAETLIARLGIPWVPGDLVDLVRFGHVVDTQKIERAGWHPTHDQESCLRLLRSG